jgi:hypothetical protein
MFRFYRKHYAATRSALVNAAVYVGIAVKLALSVARSAVGGRGRPHALLSERRRPPPLARSL